MYPGYYIFVKFFGFQVEKYNFFCCCHVGVTCISRTDNYTRQDIYFIFFSFLFSSFRFLVFFITGSFGTLNVDFFLQNRKNGLKKCRENFAILKNRNLVKNFWNKFISQLFKKSFNKFLFFKIAEFSRHFLEPQISYLSKF